jgi:hypothetical protein
MRTTLTDDAGGVSTIIQYDAANHWVHNTWFGYHTFESMTTAANVCLLPLKEYQCPYLLNDHRRLLGLWDHSVRWGVTEWLPRTLEAGLTHFAHVITPDSMATLAADALY